ncbi:putative FAD-binding dehydrogenase [Poriferisphaera corsica]|uniref:Putative FAD-binding dehydrogenase n=1 Tax=Poriferisphaera corsica TaxID=2528020 RepID=A0A517YUI0_9BACT|nr:FAD-dependent oxidoreductase [Poriferisphaera corsica]QDU33891.1 putative FAD-binding dehydrogenase [Poriferisphaera corsica]
MSFECLVKDKIAVLGEVDVMVVGGGSAGCCAAIAAGEMGVKVGLIERYGFLGGSSTQILDTFYGFFTPGDRVRKVVGGVPDMVVNRMYGTGDMFLRPNTYGAGTGVTYNPERLKLVWDELLDEAGVKVWLHAVLVDVMKEGDRVVGVVIWTKKGFYKIRASRVIDASGDADVCHLSGAAYEMAGEIDPAQTLTTTFRMSGVDGKQYEQAGGKKMLMAKMTAGVETGRWDLPRKRGSVHEMVQGGCVATVASRIADVDATDFEQLGEAEKIGRRQAFMYEDFLRAEVPGYERAKIVGLSHHVGVRETRRVYGEYRLTKEDCIEGRMFDDAVLLCGAPIEDHRKNDEGEDETVWGYVKGEGVYGVPYGTLVPKGREEIWVVGRCFSASHDAHASCRSMGQTMSMGQAAGYAAILSLENGIGACDVDVGMLREMLYLRGVVIDVPRVRAAVGRDEWGMNAVGDGCRRQKN